MRKKNLTAMYAVLQFAFWTSFAGIVAFSSQFLLSRGLRNIQIGLVIAVGGLLAALLQPAAGILMDRFPRLTSPRLLGGIYAGLLAVVGLLYLFPGAGILLTGVLYGLMVLVAQLSQSVLNVIGVDSMSGGGALRFSLARAFGSLGYALAAWAIGWLTSVFPPQVQLAVIAASGLVVLVTAWTYPLAAGPARPEASGESQALGPIAFLRRYPAFALLLAALVFIYISHAILNTFTLQIMQALGGGAGETGVTTAIAAGFELVTVLLFSLYRRRFRIVSLLRVSSLFFLLKAILSGVAASIPVYYAVQLCQMFAWGMMCVGLVYYVNDLIPDADRAKGQTYAGMTLTAANVFSGVVGGWIIDARGVPSLLLLGSALCAVGCVLFFLATAEPRAPKGRRAH